MRAITERRLREFWTLHPDAEGPLRAWLNAIAKENWHTPNDVRAAHGTASIVGDKRVVFNIKGNDYRLIVAVAYGKGIVLVKFIGTHAEYDDVDAATVEPPEE